MDRIYTPMITRYGMPCLVVGAVEIVPKCGKVLWPIHVKIFIWTILNLEGVLMTLHRIDNIFAPPFLCRNTCSHLVVNEEMNRVSLLEQGWQIFLDTIYQNWDKTKLLQHNHMAVKYTNIFHSEALQKLPKLVFWVWKYIPSGNPDLETGLDS
jgi:hypothetical protein